MNVHECLRSLGSGPPSLVYLFCPARPPKAKEASYEPFLAEQAVERIVQQYVDPALKDLCFASYYADETPPEEIVLEAMCVPFIAERRLVLVRQAERYMAESAPETILTYLETPSPSTILLLTSSLLDKRTRFYKVCEKVGLIVECPQMRAREAERWAVEEASVRGKTMNAAAARELVARTGSHLADVHNAVNLVCDYVGEASAVGEEDVVAACSDVAEEEVWALTDAIAASETGSALRALRRLLEMGKKEDDLMGIINWLLKSAYAVASAGREGPSISPFLAKKVAPLAEKLGLPKLRDAFALCTDTHFMIRSTGVDSALALELLVVKLAAPRAQTA